MNRRELYQKAKKGNEDIVVIEGIHAFKHAARFGAEFIDVVTSDKDFVLKLMRKIANEDDVERLNELVDVVDDKLFSEIISESLRTKMTALAKKPKQINIEKEKKLIIFLENPRDIDNVGAVMRVAAAANVGTVCVSGDINPWHMYAIRAGAGLQFALNVLQIESIDEIKKDRKIYACDADGKSMKNIKIERNSILVFGTERDGISQNLKKQANEIVSIPMREGVSSLNLATSVAALLFSESIV
jgi:TrmH family RNA methyltransferase